jgi:hypothetical protein
MLLIMVVTMMILIFVVPTVADFLRHWHEQFVAHNLSVK